MSTLRKRPPRSLVNAFAVLIVINITASFAVQVAFEWPRNAFASARDYMIVATGMSGGLGIALWVFLAQWNRADPEELRVKLWLLLITNLLAPTAPVAIAAIFLLRKHGRNGGWEEREEPEVKRPRRAYEYRNSQGTTSDENSARENPPTAEGEK